MNKKIKKPASFRTPTRLQMEAVECGAACLGIILAYYGRFEPLEKLRAECDVSRDGSKANNILKAARNYGLKAKGLKRETEQLADLNMPCILFWNFNHFLILEKIDKKKNKVYINDPAEGHKIITYQELEDGFTGVVLTFELEDSFEQGGKVPNILTTLQNRLKGYQKDVLFISLLTLLLVVPAAISPIFVQFFIDEILIDQEKNWLLPLLVGMTLTAFLRGWLEYLKNYYLSALETKMALSTASQFFWHVLRLPIPFFQQRYTGDIAQRLEANEKVAKMLSHEVAKNILEGVLGIFYWILMLLYSPILALVALLLAIINIIALQTISKKREESYSRLQQAEGKLQGVTTNGLQLMETLKANGDEDNFFQKWAGYQAKTLKAEQDLGYLSLQLDLIPPFLQALNILIILTLGSWLVMEGIMTIGMLVAFQSFSHSFAQPVEHWVALGGKLQETKGDIQRLHDVLQAPIDPQTHSDFLFQNQKPNFEIITQKLEGYIEFRDVTFGYSRLNPPLIENFNLKIKPGERVALVGGSGSGKSTIAKLLAGLYQPWQGEILLDGKPRKDIPREIINNSLSVVDQDIFLFEGKAKDILTIWDNTIPDNWILQAAKDAQIHTILTSRKGGYEAIIAEGGKNLSGGQRQRFEIARALVKNPSILILDEATSALDPLTEKQIENAIKKRACSVLVVAHRLSTIRDSDEIIVMRYGQIIERGTHETLKLQNGAYSALIKS